MAYLSGVEEVAHVSDHGASLAQIGEGAGAFAAKRWWEDERLDDLFCQELVWVCMALGAIQGRAYV